MAAATASPSPTAPPEPLLVISRRVSGDHANMTIGEAPDTVLLTRLDGTVVASATFKPSVRPLITNAATIFPPQVHAAAGAAYYIGLQRHPSAGNHVFFQDGTVADLPASFYSAGWWDEQTLVGYSGVDRSTLATTVLVDHQPGAVHMYGESRYAGRIDP